MSCSEGLQKQNRQAHALDIDGAYAGAHLPIGGVRKGSPPGRLASDHLKQTPRT